MKKKALFCVFALFACVGVFAQQPVVAVAPFDAISGVTMAEANMISRAFNIRLGNTQKVILVDRDVIERVLREHHFQTGDWSNQQKTAELGRALNANWIVRGNFERFGNNLLFTVSFYDITTFQFRGGDEVRVANVDAVYDHISKMVDNLVDVIGRSGAVTNVNNPVRPAAAPAGSYNIGDTGPAGGIVFFDKGFVGDGWRYLEAAPARGELTAEWGALRRGISGTGTAVGSGKRNTQIIVEQLNQLRESQRAAQICASMEINGYNDWFLPSKDELDMLYKNLMQKELGGLDIGWYWSSSQTSNRDAWGQDFRGGRQASHFKSDTYRFRAIRSF